MIAAVLKYVGGLVFDPVQYAQDSYQITKDSLLRFPPDPLPALSLLALVLATLRIGEKIINIQRSIKAADLILFAGIWIGFNAIKENKTNQIFRETVKNLTGQLDKAEEQLKEWESWYQTLKGDLKMIESATVSLDNASQGLTKAIKELRTSLEKGQQLLREGYKENESSREDLRELIAQKKEVNSQFETLLSTPPSREVQEIISEQRQNSAEWDQKFSQLEKVTTELLQKLASPHPCPHCHQTFVPIKLIKKEKNDRKSE